MGEGTQRLGEFAQNLAVNTNEPGRYSLLRLGAAGKKCRATRARSARWRTTFVTDKSGGFGVGRMGNPTVDPKKVGDLRISSCVEAGTIIEQICSSRALSLVEGGLSNPKIRPHAIRLLQRIPIAAERRQNFGDNAFSVETRLRIKFFRLVMVEEDIGQHHGAEFQRA